MKGKDPAIGSGLTGESCACLFSGLGAGQGLCCCSAGWKRYPLARASLGPELGIPGRRSPVLQRSCRRAACELGSCACRIRLPLGPTGLCLHEGTPGDSFGTLGDSFGTPGVSGEGGKGAEVLQSLCAVGRGHGSPQCWVLPLLPAGSRFVWVWDWGWWGYIRGNLELLPCGLLMSPNYVSKLRR